MLFNIQSRFSLDTSNPGLIKRYKLSSLEIKYEEVDVIF